MLRAINLLLRRLGIRSRRRLFTLISTTFVFGVFIAFQSHSLTGNVRKGTKHNRGEAGTTHSTLASANSLLFHRSFKAHHAILKLRTKNTAKPDGFGINAIIKKRFKKLKVNVNIDAGHTKHVLDNRLNNDSLNEKHLDERTKGNTVPDERDLPNGPHARKSETSKMYFHRVFHFMEDLHSIYSKGIEGGGRSAHVNLQAKPLEKPKKSDNNSTKSEDVILSIFFTSSPPEFLGVSPEDLALYKSDPTAFRCLHDEKKIPISAVNDNYCDCEDGTDEPGTSACSNGRFHCLGEGRYMLSSRVNDGLCDCCDGSDEWNKDFIDHLLKASKPVIPYAPCRNTCPSYLS